MNLIRVKTITFFIRFIFKELQGNVCFICVDYDVFRVHWLALMYLNLQQMNNMTN